MRRLEILGIILALAVVIGTPTLSFGYERFLRSQNPDEINVIARAPENGNWSLGTIRVKQGRKVTLRLTSDDVAHGMMIAGYDVEVHEIYPGKFTTVEFVADKPGRFPFFCTVMCSKQHGEMKGELIVEAADGSAPETQSGGATHGREESAGKTIFQGKCQACHGADAKGGIGPSIAGADPDKVTARVRKPTGSMPPFPPGVISDADLKALADYVSSLGQ